MLSSLKPFFHLEKVGQTTLHSPSPLFRLASVRCGLYFYSFLTKGKDQQYVQYWPVFHPGDFLFYLST